MKGTGLWIGVSALSSLHCFVGENEGMRHMETLPKVRQQRSVEQKPNVCVCACTNLVCICDK